MIKQFNAHRAGKVELYEVVIRLTGVLALLRHLRGFDGGKVWWIPLGQTAFPMEQRQRLLEAVTEIFFDGEYDLLVSTEKNSDVSKTDEIARMKGMILWLAWDCEIKFQKNKTRYSERPEEWEKRVQANGLMVALAQLSGGDAIIQDEARNTIAPFSSGELNWLKWIFTAEGKMSDLQKHPEQFTTGETAEPGYLAYNPKNPELGLRIVKNRGAAHVDLVGFLPKKKCRSFVGHSLKVIPHEEALPAMM